MPPKATVTLRKVVPKGSRKPPIQSFVATTGGSRNQPTLKRVEAPVQSSSVHGATLSDEYLTLQRVVLEEYEFDQSHLLLQSQEPVLSAAEEAEVLAQLPENPEDLTTPTRAKSGKVC